MAASQRLLRLAVVVMAAALEGAVAPIDFQGRIEGGVCYGLCGYRLGGTGGSVQPANPATGHPAGGDHVGPCGDAWQNDFDLPATGSCCNNRNLVRTLSDGSYACECPMGITCAGLDEAGGGSTCPEDVDGDGLVNVNDLLAMLSAFGSDGADGEDVDGDGTVNVNDLLQLLSAFGSDDCAAGGGGGGEPCAQGEDCGGQERTECGTACPSICGEAPASFCVRMCVIGFQCPSNLFWDPGTNGAGSCVAEADCSVSGR